MSFRWEAYLDLAQQLAMGPVAPPAPPEGEGGEQAPPPAAPPGPSEAALRTAVSRAYYSAYHLAREYVESKNLASVGKLESHTSVWKALEATRGKPRPRQEIAISVKGFALMKARKDADYEIDRPPSAPPSTPEARQRYWKGQADLAVKHAGTIRDLLAQIRT
ncbi:hypothetical protein [Sorangium sp. So ce124]|uniref:hypothetical protein n=1 Tax=Sorangium sp. So ce124 TaxID=3133280 RepID=UPI003F5DA72C